MEKIETDAPGVDTVVEYKMLPAVRNHPGEQRGVGRAI